MDARRRRGGGNFSVGHILGDPFALGTISLAFLGWLVALVGAVITQMHNEFNRFYWWALAYMLCCIIGVTIVVMTGEPEKYQIAVVGFMAVAVAYNTFAVSSVVFTAAAEEEATAAGFILLSMMSILWIGYFGTSSQARPRGYIDSFALNKEQRLSMRGSRPMSTNPYDSRTPNNNSSGQPQMYSSAAMNGGLEQTSNMSGYAGGGGMGTGASTSQARFAQQPMQTSAPRSPVAGSAPGGGFGTSMAAGAETGAPAGAAPGGEVPNPTEFPYRAKAIYSYEANPDDANEISFTKHEILEVSDVSGRWWQARKENGETGIAPSNYLILL